MHWKDGIVAACAWASQIHPITVLTAEVEQVVVLAPPAVREVPYRKQGGTEARVQLVEALRRAAQPEGADPE